MGGITIPAPWATRIHMIEGTSQVSITLMRKKSNRAHALPPGPRVAPFGKKILIIDDDPDACSCTRALLKEKGHRILTAADGKQGIALADREEPDLIILDTDMPGMDGYEVSAALAEQPHTAFIPVLMLSDSRDPEEVNRILNGFADDVVSKPIDPSELLARVGALIRCTHRLTQGKRVHHWVIRRLANRAQRRGFHVYSRHLEHAPNAPLDWRGPLPDLLVIRRGAATAYLVESVESLHDEKAISRWQALERMGNLRLHVIAQGRETAQLARKIKKERGFNARIQWSRPRPPRRRWFGRLISPSRVPFVFATLVALLVSLFVSGVIPNLFVYYEEFDKNLQVQMNIYQPKDAERHLYRIDKIMRGFMK